MHHKTFIIAEAGVNHNGSLEKAMQMIDEAVKAKVNAIKFQTFKAEKFISRNAPKAEYQKANTRADETQLDMLRKLELNEGAHKSLIDYCKENRIIFISTPFDLESIDLLENLGLEIFKIGSGEITNLPYLRKIGALKKQIILSTGMSRLDEIEKALNILTESGTAVENVALLHCNTEYPTPFKDVNLKAMMTIKKAFPKVKVGYSDHTLGIEAPIAAVALGAKVIEKHFTLNKQMDGPDHIASLEPQELVTMVNAIRNIENAMGDGIKEPSSSELKNIIVARKSIVAAKNICKGEIFSEENLTVKRPGTGISPMKWDEVIGKRADRNYNFDEIIHEL